MLSVKRVVVGELESNCYFIYNDKKEAIIIDPGAEPKRLIDVIEQLGLNVDCIILTHGHFDHIGAVDEISDKYNCDVLISSKDEVLLSDATLNLSSRFYGKSIICKSPYKTFDDNYSCEMIGEAVTMISTPGHTPGSCCVKISDMIFSGDTLFKLGVGNQFPPYGNMAEEICSIKEKLMTSETDAICYPGHGESTTIFFEKENNPYLCQGDLWI